MSQPFDSEADDSRTQHFRSKRNLRTAGGDESGASTPSKRSRRNRRGRQNPRDFVPVGGNFSTSGHMLSAASEDTSEGSSAVDAAHDDDSHRARSSGVGERTDEQSNIRPKSLGGGPVLGQNRLITGFAKSHSQSSAAVQDETLEATRKNSISYNSVGESADDAIEISDDTDMEDPSEDGGMVINVDDENDSDELVSLLQYGAKRYQNARRFCVSGWVGNKTPKDSAKEVKNLCKFLEKKAFPKQVPSMKFLDYEQVGDSLIISVRPEDAASLTNLNGCMYAGNAITVEDHPDIPSTPQQVDMSDGEIDEAAAAASPQPALCSRCGKAGHKPKSCRRKSQLPGTIADEILSFGANSQLRDSLEHSVSATARTEQKDNIGQPLLRLGDLKAEELEKQVRYTLFHLNRDQIDLSRPAMCTACLQEGHRQASCPESTCIHCGVADDHSSRMCPKFRRCLKCRERGHDIDTCISKLKNTTVPCDHCMSETHLEDSCPFRFFPIPSPSDRASLKLWISCCICASKTHLVGDCPEKRPSSQAATWSLKSLDPIQISNLSLESGTRKTERDFETRGMRSEGLKIKGRADTYGQIPQFNFGNDKTTNRPALGGQDYSPRRADRRRFEERDFERDRRAGDGRQGGRSDLYRPSKDNRAQTARHDRYESSYTAYRDQSNDRRDKFYGTDSFGQRRRSRSPNFRSTKATQRHDSFQPPLPKEPLPSRSPLPWRSGPHVETSSDLPSQRMDSSRQFLEDGKPKQGNRRQKLDQGPPGVDSYRPMPSAAKQAWDKHRL